MDAGATMTFLVLGMMLGFLGQGARAIVGLASGPGFNGGPPNQSDVFSAARLTVSLLIGVIAGFAAALTELVVNKGIATITTNELLAFASAGYIGVDAIEAFIGKYLGKPSTSSSGTDAPSTMSLTDLDTHLQAIADIQRSHPITPTLKGSDVLAFLKDQFGPDLKKWKETDAIPPGTPNDADAFRFAIGALFRRQGLRYWPTVADDVQLKPATYATMAASIGRLFDERGGRYVA